MKPSGWVWSLAGGVVGAMVVLALQGRWHAVDRPGRVEPPPAVEELATLPPTAAPLPAERVIHTFADDTQMNRFLALWQQREGLKIRQAVVGAYLQEEQAALNAAEQALKASYPLDLTQEYRINRRARTLVELPADWPEDVQMPPTGGSAARVARTFASEEELTQFAQLWSERQAHRRRLRMLQVYGGQEATALQDVESALAREFHLDPGRSYRLDTERRALTEQAP